jgi:hypothetical protein
MFKGWSNAKLDHAIACAERSSDGRAHTKRGSYTLEQLRKARPPTFPLPPFTSETAYRALHAKQQPKAVDTDVQALIVKLFGQQLM